MKLKTCGILFSGHNPRAIIAFCRFAVDRGIQFYIVANGDEDPIFKSDYKKNVVITRPKNQLALKDVIGYANHIKDVSGAQAIVILPTTEYLNRFLLRHHEELKHNNITTGLCDMDVYEEISDKFAFGDLCRRNGINVPKEFDDFPETYPYVIKPREYKVGNNVLEKPIIVCSQADIDNTEKRLDLEDIYIQEYIGGQSFYLLCYFYKNGDVVMYSQENLVQQNNGRSMILAKSTGFHHNKISERFISTFKAKEFFGLVMIEAKLFNDEVYMIEANPRFWGPSQLINDANMSLFDSFAVDNGLMSSFEPKQYLENIWYYWSGGKIMDDNNGLSLSYYNFSVSEFEEKEDEFKQNDVYYKDDTINIYNEENNIS